MSEMLPNAIIVALHTNYTLGHLVQCATHVLFTLSVMDAKPRLKQTVLGNLEEMKKNSEECVLCSEESMKCHCVPCGYSP